MAIERVAVVGAGVMGAGIAAHCANAGLQVLLLDIVPEGAADRDAIAKTAIQKMLKADPAPFMTKRAAERVRPGNVEDHLEQLAACDWIVEAVVEKPEVKRALYEKIERVRKDGSVVSSNTSTLRLRTLVEGLPERFRRDFLITHFFNPPRYMRLLEIVAGPETRGDAVAEITDLADRRLGKTVIRCHDRPGFIANRLGAFWIQAAIRHARELGLTVEEADAVMGRPFGFPKTGVFGLLDLVGLDLVPHVDASLRASLPASDPYHAVRADFPLMAKLIAEGYTGRKGKGGFYRLRREGEQRIKEAVDLALGSYAPAKKPLLAGLEAAKTGGPAALLAAKDKAGAYARAVLGSTLAYACTLVPEVTDDITAVDDAMRLGYNWTYGPFALIDKLGAKAFAAGLRAQGLPVPPLLATATEREGFYRTRQGILERLTVDGAYVPVTRPEGVLLLEDLERRSQPVARNRSASLWDVGDGVLCLEVHTKLNTLDPDVLAMIGQALAIVPKAFKALVIYNEAEQFSAGANIGLALFAANVGAWPMIEELVEQGQKAYSALRHAPFPVVAAPSGLALGGGCEILLASDAVQAHAESYVGLVECGVGVVPAWGGCARLMARLAADPRRPKGPLPPVAQAFETIGMAKIAKSAFEARELGFLTREDGITFNRDRLLADAKAKALSLAKDYTPPQPPELRLPGPTGKAALGLALHDLELKGLVTPHDKVVADALADVLTGGEAADLTRPTTEAEIMALERRAFMRLLRTEPTLARIEHTLDSGKPLRN